MIKVDARGMSCPQPVLMVKKAIDASTKSIEILVDNTTAQNNITRYLKSEGFTKVEYASQEDDTLIKGNR